MGWINAVGQTNSDKYKEVTDQCESTIGWLLLLVIFFSSVPMLLFSIKIVVKEGRKETWSEVV